MYDDPRVEESDVEDDFPAPPAQAVQPAVANHGQYQIRYDNYSGQPYYHGHPSSGFYLPPGPSGLNTGNQNDVDLREYADLLTEDNTPTNEMERYQSAPELNQLYPQLPGADTGSGQNRIPSPTDAQVREWSQNSPIAENIRRILSDGSFSQGHTSETNQHWNTGSPQGVAHSSSGYDGQTVSLPVQMQNVVQQQADLQNMLVFPGVSAAISSKIDSLTETVKSLVTTMYDVVNRVNDIESSSRPSSVASIPERLQPRQGQRTVDPVHKQRLQKVLANSQPPRKQVQINAVPQVVSITPQPAPSASRIAYPPFPGTVRRPDVPPPGFATKPPMPTVPQHAVQQTHAETRMPPNAYPMSASVIAPHTGHKYYLPPDACMPYGLREQQYVSRRVQDASQAMPPRHANEALVYRPTPVTVQQTRPQANGRDVNQPAVSDFGRNEYAHIVHRPVEVTGRHTSSEWPGGISVINPRPSASNDASDNSLVAMLLFSTVSQQLKKLSGRDGLERAKDYFREFEGLTRAWNDKQKTDLLGIKVIDSARLAFEAYEKDASHPLFEEAKQAILDALSVEDNRKVGAWTDLKNLQQTEKESVTEFGTRVKQTVRDAMGHMQSSSQLEKLNKKYFIDGLRDIGIRRSLAAQLERSRYTDLIRDGAVIERSCPAEAPRQPPAKSATQAWHNSRPSESYQGNGGYNSSYNGQRRYYGNTNSSNNSGNQAYQQRSYVQNGSSSSGNAQQNNGYRQYNGNNQRQNWQNNNFQKQPSQNAGQQPNLTGGNAVRQAQNFQFPRSPSRQGAAQEGTASR